MFDNLGSVAATAGILVGLFGSAGYGLQRGRVGTLRDELKDERERVTSLKEQRTERDQKIADLQAVVRIATGEVHSQAILDLLEHHSTEARRGDERIEDMLQQVISILTQRPKP